MCTSAITAWTSRLTCSTRSIATATQSAPSHTPSTTSPSGSHPKETSRWEWWRVLTGWGCSPGICYWFINTKRYFKSGGNITAQGTFCLGTSLCSVWRQPAAQSQVKVGLTWHKLAFCLHWTTSKYMWNVVGLFSCFIPTVNCNANWLEGRWQPPIQL